MSELWTPCPALLKDMLFHPGVHSKHRHFGRIPAEHQDLILRLEKQSERWAHKPYFRRNIANRRIALLNDFHGSSRLVSCAMVPHRYGRRTAYTVCNLAWFCPYCAYLKGQDQLKKYAEAWDDDRWRWIVLSLRGGIQVADPDHDTLGEVWGAMGAFARRLPEAFAGYEGYISWEEIHVNRFWPTLVWTPHLNILVRSSSGAEVEVIKAIIGSEWVRPRFDASDPERIPLHSRPDLLVSVPRSKAHFNRLLRYIKPIDLATPYRSGHLLARAAGQLEVFHQEVRSLFEAYRVESSEYQTRRFRASSGKQFVLVERRHHHFGGVCHGSAAFAVGVAKAQRGTKEHQQRIRQLVQDADLEEQSHDEAADDDDKKLGNAQGSIPRPPRGAPPSPVGVDNLPALRPEANTPANARHTVKQVPNRTVKQSHGPGAGATAPKSVALELEVLAADTDAQSELRRCESTIREGLRSTYRAAVALRTIHDRELYKPAYRSFRAYCDAVWGMKGRTGYHVIATATVAENLADVTPGAQIAPEIFLAEYGGVVRVLAGLPAPEQRKLWNETVKETGGRRPTRIQLQEKVDALKAASTTNREAKACHLEATRKRLEKELLRVLEKHLAAVSEWERPRLRAEVLRTITLPFCGADELLGRDPGLALAPACTDSSPAHNPSPADQKADAKRGAVHQEEPEKPGLVTSQKPITAIRDLGDALREITFLKVLGREFADLTKVKDVWVRVVRTLPHSGRRATERKLGGQFWAATVTLTREGYIDRKLVRPIGQEKPSWAVRITDKGARRLKVLMAELDLAVSLPVLASMLFSQQQVIAPPGGAVAAAGHEGDFQVAAEPNR